MGWSLGFDTNWNRDIGYSVPAYCDHPGCKKEIDRGLSYVCGEEPYGGELGCGLFFCTDHLEYYNKRVNGKLQYVSLCKRCGTYKKTFYKPSPDHPKWIQWKKSNNNNE